MAEIVLFHSALGLRPAVIEFADALRREGHSVITPDYYDGAVFDDYKAGLAHRDDVGVKELMNRAKSSLEEVSPTAVLGGFSLGAFFAQAFAAKRPESGGAILLHNVSAPRGDWNGVNVQLHRYASDPFVAEPDVEALSTAVAASGAQFEDFVTPGKGHLFTDLAMPDGDAHATEVTLRRIQQFLGG